MKEKLLITIVSITIAVSIAAGGLAMQSFVKIVDKNDFFQPSSATLPPKGLTTNQTEVQERVVKNQTEIQKPVVKNQTELHKQVVKVQEPVSTIKRPFTSNEQREGAINELIMADPRLTKYKEGAYNWSVDVLGGSKDSNGSRIDNVVLHVYGKETVEGNWRQGYTSTVTNNTDVKMQIKSARIILSIESYPAPDQVHSWNYTEAEQKIIENMLTDATVNQKMAEREGQGLPIISMSRQIYSNLYDCGQGECKMAYIYLGQIGGSSLSVLIDRNGNVVDVKGWT